VEESAARDQRLGRPLDVEDPGAGRHPLRRTVGNQAPAAGRVLVLKGSVDHVGDGLESAMRVPGGTLRFPGAVFHLAHLVHVNEGVEVALVEPVKGPPHREALAFDTLRRRRDGEHRALDGAGRVRDRDSRQRQDVVDGDRRHCIFCNRVTRAAIPDASPPGSLR